MIQPEEIIKKAETLYPKAVTAILHGRTDFFPHRLACNLKLPTDHAELIRSVDLLRSNSKSVVGYGYSVTYQSKRSHQHGRNEFPDAVYIESIDDLTRMLRKVSEYRHLMNAVKAIRDSLPELENWICDNWTKLISLSAEVVDLVSVTCWLKSHPRPGCFPRELPLPVSSKLIETNWRILAAWWDKVLPHDTIDYGVDPKNYAQRYGFRWVQPHLLVRLLDENLKARMCVPFKEFSLPPDELSGWNESAKQLKCVVIVENKVNLLTFPAFDRSIALGGLGFGVTTLNQVTWFRDVDIIYWGDLDVEGFQILSLLRSFLPQAKSWLMDLETLQAHLPVLTPGNGVVSEVPPQLTAAEQAAYAYCRDRNVRLEQERIPQSYLTLRTTDLF